jgi:hypothetical protein
VKNGQEGASAKMAKQAKSVWFNCKLFRAKEIGWIARNFADGAENVNELLTGGYPYIWIK